MSVTQSLCTYCGGNPYINGYECSTCMGSGLYQGPTVASPLSVAGRTVIEHSPIRIQSGTHPNCIVLAFDPNAYDRYVTWVAYTTDDGGTWEAESGHYMNDLSDALADFNSRK